MKNQSWLWTFIFLNQHRVICDVLAFAGSISVSFICHRSRVASNSKRDVSSNIYSDNGGSLSATTTKDDSTPQVETDVSRSHSSQARPIISLIESRYNPSFQACIGSAQNTSVVTTCPEELPWRKMRTYVYHATSTSVKQPLTMEQVLSVLEFLEHTFGKRDTLMIPIILTVAPRVLRKNPETTLKPTVHFLQKIYPKDMFFEAIKRNPKLLLTIGVGYNTLHTRRRKAIQGAPVEEFVTSTTVSNHISHNVETVESFLTSSIVEMTCTQIEKLKSKNPKMFQLSVSDHVKPVIQFLNLISVPQNKTDMDDPTNDKPLAEDSRDLIRRVILSNPNILSLNVESNLKPKIAFLMDRCSLNQEDMRSLLKYCPGILGLSLVDKIEPVVDFIESMLLSRQVDVMHKKQYSNLKSTVFTTESDDSWRTIGRERLRSCITRHPQILALSLENLSSKVSYFNAIEYSTISRLRSTTESATNTRDDRWVHETTTPSLVARIALGAPSAFSLSLENNLIPTIECLGSVWGSDIPDKAKLLYIDSSQYDVHDYSSSGTIVPFSQYLGEYPAILTLSLEANILPTLNFYNQTGYISLDNLGRGNNYSFRSRYIAASLFNRLLPRWSYYLEMKNSDSCEQIKLPSVHLLAAANDLTFCEKLGFELEHFLLHKETTSPALKFSSQFDTWLKTGRPID